MRLPFERKIIFLFSFAALFILVVGIISYEEVPLITLLASGLSFIVVIVSMVIIRRDLIAHRTANKEIRMLAEALRSIKESIVITDTRNKVLFVNKSFEKIYGYSEAEVMGKNLQFLRPAGLPEEQFEDVYIRTLNGGWSGELINRRKDGSEFPIQLSTSSVKDELNNPVALIGVSSDISERKKTESEIQNYIEELHKSRDVISGNAAKLQELNSKLMESEKQLRQLNESKDKFFSIISHDLRSPFNSLLGLTDLLKNEIDEFSKEEIQLFSANVYSSAKQLLNLVDELLEWSRIQTGKIDFEPVECDLYVIVSGIITLLKGNADKKRIEIVNQVKKNSIIYADEYMVNSIIRNLITNAIKFTHEGGRVVVSEKCEGNAAEISISDTGIGIEEEEISKLFVIGGKRSSPGTASEKGTGIGLILCKELVEKHGGRIWVESKLGEGSAFNFTLPVCKK